MKTWIRNAPGRLQECLKRYGEVANTPATGIPENYMLPSWQMNISQVMSDETGDPLVLCCITGDDLMQTQS